MISLNTRWATVAGIAALCAAGCGEPSDDAQLTAGTAEGSDSAATTGGESGSDSGPGGDTWETGPGSSTGTSTGTGTGTGPSDACGFDEGSCCDQYWPEELSLRHVTLSVTVNETVHEGSIYDDGDIYLAERATGDRAYFGRVNQGIVSAWVLEGQYDVVYESRAEASTLPENKSIAVVSKITVDGEHIEFDVDIDSVEVELTLMVNGDAPTLSDYDDGVLSISETGYKDRTVVGKTSEMTDGKLTMHLVPGNYEIFYESEDRQIKMPYNRLAKIGEVEVADPEKIQYKQVDLEVVELSGEIFFDGKPPPPSAYDHGRIYLQDQLTGAITEIADTATGNIGAIPVVGGSASYDVFYAADTVQSGAPANTWGRLNTVEIMGTDAALNAAELKTNLVSLKIQTITVTGEITVDDESKPADPDNRGNLLVGDGFGERAEIGDVAGGIQARLLRSDYDVFFRHEVSDGGLPANTFGIVGEDRISAMQNEPLVVDLATSVVSGIITVNGELPPLSDYDKGEVFLRSAAGDRVFLAQTSSGSYSRRIMNGTYDVYYTVVNSQGGVPANHETLIEEGLMITGGLIDYHVSIQATYLSRILPDLDAEATGQARFFVRKIGTEDELFVGKSGDAIDVLLLDGDYELIYRVENRGSRTPVNDGAVVGCVPPG